MISIKANALIVTDDLTKESLIISNIHSDIVAIHIYDTRNVISDKLVAKISRVRIITVYGKLCMSMNAEEADELQNKISKAFEERRTRHVKKD